MIFSIPQEFLKALATERGVSEAELEALFPALEGQSTTEIAQNLGITPIAVRKRLGEVYRKFDITGSGPGKLGELERILTSEYQASLKIAERRQDWGEAPDISVFYGRTEELATLEQWTVKERCRLVGILGMGGIGKTTLCAKLVKQIQDKFEYIIWRSLHNAPPLWEVLADLLKFLSSSQSTELPENVDERISQLISYLREHRCLLVLDDVETILRIGERVGRYSKGYEDYGVFFRRMGEEQHQSCLVLNSLEKPREIALLESPTRSVRSLQLAGLKPEEARKILQEKGLTGEQKWSDLIQDYRGSPLALKIVATTIQDLFGRNVAEFIKHRTIVIGDMFREILDQQFNRLSELEKKIMQCLASESKPVSLVKLRELLSTTLTTSELIEALESLGWRSLIEKTQREDKDTSEPLFALQPIVKKYVNKYHGASNSGT